MITFYDRIILAGYNPPDPLYEIEVENYEELAIGSELFSSFRDENNNAELIQCCIQSVNKKWWVTPLKTNYGCYKRVQERCRIMKGETVKTGNHYLTYVKNDENSAQCYLRYKGHTKKVKVSFEENKAYKIGRNFVKNETEVVDDTISNFHFQIKYKDGKLYIEDAGMIIDKPSVNGTWIKLEQKTVVLRSPVTLMLGTDTYLILQS